MENVTETCRTPPKLPVIRSGRKPCLVHIYPTGPGMGTRYALGDTPLMVGRDRACDIQLNDQSVSRRHVRIQPGLDGDYVIDLQSTNGTFVNDRPATTTKLKDGDYLRIGNWIFRYLAGGNVESEYHEEIYRLTIIDALTGIHNKRYLLEFLERELSRAVRHRRPLGLILFDIDRFKSINDTLGHLAGDGILRELAACVRTLVTPDDLFARYGGEEFAVVLPENTLEAAGAAAERIRQAVAAHPFQYDGQRVAVTVSLGVVATRGDEQLGPEEVIRQADYNLYKAKDQGRNCVVGGSLAGQ